jgi:short-subunit dehydrogenase
MQPYALITGASTGIGREIAKYFAKDQIPLILVSRNVALLEKVRNDLIQISKQPIELLSMDLSQPQSAGELYYETQALGLEVGYLVNNAGFGNFGNVRDLPEGIDEELLQLNTVTLTGLTKRFLPAMLEQGRGRILNVASTAAFQPIPNMAAYAASKAYVLHYSEALAEELKGSGVTVSTLCPGPTATKFGNRAGVEILPFFERLLVMTAEKVAKEGYDGMQVGKRIIINGKLNQFGTFLNRFSPRWLSCWIAGQLMQSVKRRSQTP